MDEPSVGLHPADRPIDRGITWFARSRNTVLVVEHDTETLLACDHLLEVGPGAGTEGVDLFLMELSKDVSVPRRAEVVLFSVGKNGLKKMEKEKAR